MSPTGTDRTVNMAQGLWTWQTTMTKKGKLNLGEGKPQVSKGQIKRSIFLNKGDND